MAEVIQAPGICIMEAVWRRSLSRLRIQKAHLNAPVAQLGRGNRLKHGVLWVRVPLGVPFRHVQQPIQFVAIFF